MSKNCILSKLKGVVDNNDLDRYGYITLKNFRRVYVNGNVTNIKINSLDERVFYSDSACTTSIGTTATLAGNIYAPAGFGDAYITKYSSENVEQVNTYTSGVKLEDLAFLNPKSISGNSNIKGSLSAFNSMSRLSMLTINGTPNKITGNIVELVPILYRHYTEGSTQYITINSPLIEGEFNDVVSALSDEMYEYGENSYVWYIVIGDNNKVTCNGTLVNGRRVNVTYNASTGDISAVIIN